MFARFRGLASIVVSVALICATPVTASAQDKEADNKAAAKEHWSRGTSFYDLGRYDQAITEFEAAYQLKNDPAFLFNLAQAYRMAGKHERAVHFYKTYLRYVPKAPNRADIEEKIKTGEQLAAQQAAGTLPPPTTTTPPPVTTTTPPPPGSTTPPPSTQLGTVPTPPGELPPVETPPSGYVPPTTETTSDPGRKFRIAGLAAAGTGALMYLLAIYQWRRAASASSDIEAAARAGLPFDPATQERGQSAETQQAWWFVLGTLAIGGGVGLWYYGNRLSQTSETTTWRIVLAPSVAPNQGGAILRVTF
jgi:tetratricopeptide (TPR) repeat protein